MKRLLFCVLCLAPVVGCVPDEKTTNSNSEVKRVHANVHVNSQGMTTEQQNIRDRLLEDNKPGAIKHLYVMSAYSGQVIIYSTVRGKVTSGGKRLSPTTVHVGDGQGTHRFYGYNTGDERETGEVLQDDGSYGSSIEYLYFWDTNGRYRQLYPSAGAIIVISDTPLATKSVTLNLELRTPKREKE